MQLNQESTKRPNPPRESEVHNILISYTDNETQADRRRAFDLANHEDRVGFSKFTMWAVNRKIDFTVRNV